MSLEETVNRLVDRFAKNDLPRNEEEAKNQVIIPILGELGWDVYRKRGTSEVEYERSVRHNKAASPDRIDIALYNVEKRKPICVCLIEAKAPSKNLEDHVKQLYVYAMQEGADLCILTNAREWWLYLPREKAEDRRFARINFAKDNPDQIIGELEQFLGRENVLDGTAEDQARERIKELENLNFLNDELPDIWKEMQSDPNQDLVELITQVTYTEIGLSPSFEQVKALLRRDPFSNIPNPRNESKPRPESKLTLNQKSQPGAQSSGGKSTKPSYIVLFEKQHSIETYKDILFKVVEALHNMYEPRLLETLSENWDDVSWLISSIKEDRKFETRDNISYWVNSRGNHVTIFWKSRKLLKETDNKPGDLRVFNKHGQELDVKGSRVLPILDGDSLQQDEQTESASRKRGPIPTSFTLLGQTHQSRSRAALPVDVMKLVWDDRSGDFEKLKTLSLGKYFSSTIEELDTLAQIGDSDFYLEKNRDAIDLLKAAYFLLEALGYEHSDLAIEYPDGIVGPGTKLIPGNEDIEVEVRAPRPVSFVLLGEMTSTSSHSHIAQSVYDTMFETHGDRFAEIENHPGNRRAIISQTPEELVTPRSIGDSGYYLEAGLFSMKKSLDRRLWTCHQLLGALGYTEDDFEIHPEPETQSSGQSSSNKHVKPSYLVLFGEQHSVKRYKDVLFKVVETLHGMYKPRLLEMLSVNWDNVNLHISSRKENEYFEHCDNTPYWVHTVLSAATAIRKSRKLLEETGNNANDLKIFDEYGRELNFKIGAGGRVIRI